MAIKTVDEMQVKFGTVTIGVTSAPHANTESVEDVEVTTLSDRVKKFRPSSVKDIGEFSVEATDVATLPTVGSTDTVTITASLDNGTASSSETITVGKCYVKSVTPNTIDGSTRVASWTIVFRPTGE